MPVGRVLPRDPIDEARERLLWALDNADGEALERAVYEGGEWVHKRPYDDEVAEALERAERRLAGPAAD